MKRNIFLTAVAVCLAGQLRSQDTVWLSKSGNIVSKDSAQRYQVIFRNDTDTQLVKVLSFKAGGILLCEANYYPYSPKPVFHGVSRQYKDGQLEEERFYTNGRLNGYLQTYWENGRIKRKDWYEKGDFVRGNCYGLNGNDSTWFPYESLASFPGGIDSLRRFITKNIKYPPMATLEGKEGTVKVSFIVNKEGSLDSIRVINPIYPPFEREALRLVGLMPKWIPGRIDGRTVNMAFLLPVTFRLNY